jgi:hypothetical protein
MKHVQNFRNFLNESVSGELFLPIRNAYAEVTAKPHNVKIEKAKLIGKEDGEELWNIPFKGRNGIITARVKNGELNPIVYITLSNNRRMEINIEKTSRTWKYLDEAT